MGPWKLLKKLIGVLRGGATPVEIGMAVILGVLTGFIPGFSLLTLLLITLVLLLNVSVGLFLFSLVLGKLLSLALAPVTYGAGKLLLDVPPVAEGVGALANAPVAAWMDLDRYCTLGGAPVGLVIGLVLSLLLIKPVKLFRTKMADLESGSQRFQAWSKKWYVRLFSRVLLGKRKAKGMTYAQILEKKTRVVRKAGLVVALLFLALVAAGEFLLAGAVTRRGLVWAMEKANGATVDIEAVNLSVFSGKCVVTGVHICDPHQLDRDRVRIQEIVADLDVDALLRKKFVIDELSVADVKTDALRETPGEKLAEPPEPPEEAKPPERTKSLIDYLEDAKRWRDRLARLQDFLEKVKRKSPDEAEQSRRKQAERFGYRDLRADHLVKESPRLLVRKLHVAGIVIGDNTDTVYDATATDLSDNAALAEADPKITITSRDKTVSLNVRLSLTDPEQPHSLDLLAKGVDLGKAQRALSKKNPARFSGGQADLSVTGGTFAADRLDLPLGVTLTGLEASGGEKGLLGLDPKFAEPALAALDNLNTTLHIQGKPFAPYVTFNVPQLLASLKQAAVAAGKKELANRIGGELDKVSKKYGVDVRDLLPGSGKGPMDTFRGILDRKDKKKDGGKKKGRLDKLKTFLD